MYREHEGQKVQVPYVSATRETFRIEEWLISAGEHYPIVSGSKTQERQEELRLMNLLPGKVRLPRRNVSELVSVRISGASMGLLELTGGQNFIASGESQFNKAG